MEVIQDSRRLKIGNVVTIGSYDGVHYGHRMIIDVLMSKASEMQLGSVVLTMYPHPRKVLNLDLSKLSLLNSFKEKSFLLDKIGVTTLYAVEFTKEFGNLSGEEFVVEYLVNRLNAKCVIVGYDHRFGHNRESGYDLLKELGCKYGFDVIQISKQMIDDANISSTTIRGMLNSGDIVNANKYLCHPYFFIGRVGEGGALEVEDELKLIPKEGEYLAEIDVVNSVIQVKIRISGDKKIFILDRFEQIENHIMLKIIDNII